MRNKTRTCEFENLQVSLIRDRNVCEIDDINIRKRLLHDNNLSLDRASETSKSQVHKLDGKIIDIIKRSKANLYQNQTQFRRPNFNTIKKTYQPTTYNNTPSTLNNLSRHKKHCYYCGTKYGR